MRRFFVSFVFAVFFATAVAESEQYDDEFEAFVHRFSKVYSTPEERTMRKSLWLSRKQQYDLLNSQHNGATFAVNGFGDMTDAELDAMLMHPTIPSREEAALVEARAEPPTITDPEHPRHHKRATPTHWNWCNSSDFANGCTPVVSQGSCGSCWVFGYIAQLESQWAIAKHELLRLSHQQMIDCNTHYGGTGCCGGWPHYLAQQFTGNVGYHLSSDYPYVDGSKGSSSPACSSNLHTCQTHPYLASITGYDQPVLDGTAIMDYLYTYGPFASTMFIEPAFYGYSGGIYSNTTSKDPDDHVVVIVGFGVSDTGQKYLLCRNSWGSGWGGIGGFFKVDLTNRCGLCGNIGGYWPVSVRSHVSCVCTQNNSCCDGCSFRKSTTICRPSAGACDAAEYCTGLSDVCPSNSFRSSSYICRYSYTPCDVAENCTGTSATCPSDTFRPSSVMCRNSTQPCQAPAFCTGTSGTCPSNPFRPSTFVCRSSTGSCDPEETCTGGSGPCPADVSNACGSGSQSCPCPAGQVCCTGCAPRPTTYTCRAKSGDCDIADNCNGVTGDCPTDRKAADGISCTDQPCFSNSSCKAGACVGIPAPCPSGWNPHKSSDDLVVGRVTAIAASLLLVVACVVVSF